jgi:predicted carbohydrate-binding protein with CBM5 and CBM33 domain
VVDIHTPVPVEPRHGYMRFPKSRAVLCREEGMGGAIQWEPQSVEAPKGFPQYGPPDGQLGSAGHTKFSALDGVLDPKGRPWKPTQVTRASTVQWNWWITAKHSTTKFEYFVTRDGWDQGSKLTRAHFEVVPFLTVKWDESLPVEAVSHWGRLSDKSGRHVVYGVWTIADTAMAFYQMCDVELV